MQHNISTGLKKGKVKDSSKDYSEVSSIKNMSTSEINDWVDTNVDTIADIRECLKELFALVKAK